MSAMLNVLHNVPLVRIVLFFALGICASAKGLDAGFSGLAFVTGFLFLLLHVLVGLQAGGKRYSFRWCFGVSVSAFVFGFGVVFTRLSATFVGQPSANCYVAVVCDGPRQEGASLGLPVSVTEVSEGGLKLVSDPFRAQVFLPAGAQSRGLKAGDSLLFYAKNRLVSVRNEEVARSADGVPVMFVEDGQWRLLSASAGIGGAQAVRDSMLGLLKKKDVQRLN